MGVHDLDLNLELKLLCLDRDAVLPRHAGGVFVLKNCGFPVKSGRISCSQEVGDHSSPLQIITKCETISDVLLCHVIMVNLISQLILKVFFFLFAA